MRIFRWDALVGLGGIILFVVGGTLSAQEGGKPAYVATGVLASPFATQAAAADEKFVYAVDDHVVVKYDRATGKELARSTGKAQHLNSGFLWQGKLYCAHSNYPRKPHESDLRVLDPQTMELKVHHAFIDPPGSLTWAVRRGEHWWCHFAHYGNDNPKSLLVKFDERWQELARWTYPKELVADWGTYSLSGGIWHDNDLLATGHDKKVIYRLKIPQVGKVVQLIEAIAAPFPGQGIATDTLTGGLVGIDRGRKHVVFAATNGRSPPIVDTHTHCFAGKASKDFLYHRNGPYQPEEAASPELLLERMKQAGVDFAIVVHPEPYQDDHRYLEHCLKVGKGRLKGTCLFFAEQEDSVKRMHELVQRHPKQIVALRIHAYAEKRLPPFGKPELKRLWKAAGDLGLAVQLNCEPRFAAGFEPLIEEFPRTIVIIDHLGLPYSNKLEQHAIIMKWARFPNTVMKISALPDRQKFPDRDVAPLLREMIKAFTPRRLIYGGGFNDTPTGDAYRAQREEIRAPFAHLPASDQALIFGGNAARLFGFDK